MNEYVVPLDGLYRLDAARVGAKAAVLEYHNHYLNQMSVGQLRHAVLAAADWLVNHGALAEREDAFWLYFDEITASLRIDAADSLASTVAARQTEHQEWKRLEAPPVLGVPDARLPDRPPLRDELTLAMSQAEDTINGVGASPGRHRGRARVVGPAVLLPDVSPGDVLVAENAGPRWTPVFPILGGLVLDSGSIGQHAAATAREYGIPAVTETQDATRLIRDGVYVMVDGTKGTVELAPDPS